MIRASTTLLATALSTAVIPAFAAWERIGSVNIAAGKTEQFTMENFNGNVIGLTAREADVMCDRVTATFSNGTKRPIFKGQLLKGISVRVDLPPGAVERVDFECHAIKGGQATLDLAANTLGTLERKR